MGEAPDGSEAGKQVCWVRRAVAAKGVVVVAQLPEGDRTAANWDTSNLVAVADVAGEAPAPQGPESIPGPPSMTAHLRSQRQAWDLSSEDCSLAKMVALAVAVGNTPTLRCPDDQDANAAGRARIRGSVADSAGLGKARDTAAARTGRAHNLHSARTGDRRTRPARVDSRTLRPGNEHTQGTQAHQTQNTRRR